MCGRYALHADPRVVALRFGFAAAPAFAPRFNICPGSEVFAVRAAEQGTRIAGEYRWGLIPHWAKDPAIGHKLANARGESLEEKRAFRDAFRRARCLVPASGYYEWRTVAGTKHPWYLHPADDPLFALAGLASLWRGPQGIVHSLSLITTPPNRLTGRVHDRMPLIIAAENYDAWLDPDNRDAAAVRALVRPYPDERMRAYPVSARVNTRAVDDASLIEPLADGPPQRDLL